MDKPTHPFQGPSFLNHVVSLLTQPWLWFMVPLSLFVPMAWFNFISHSEFWGITSSQLFGIFNDESIVIYYRPTFYALLKTLYFFPMDNVTHIKAARVIFGVIASINTLLVALIVNQWTQSRKVTTLYLLFLLTFHTFFYNFFRVRSDMLALFFILLAIFYTNHRFLAKKKLIGWPILALLLLSFLSTPKSICLVFSFSAYILCLEQKAPKTKNKLWYILFYFSVPLIIVSTVSLILFILNLSEKNPFLFALIYFLNNMDQLLTYYGWSNVVNSFNINYLHYICIASGLLFFYRKDWGSFGKAPWILSLATAIFFGLYSEKWDYYYASLFPLMAAPAILTLQRISKSKYFPLLLLPLFVTPFFMTRFTGWSFSNEKQLTTVADLGQLVKQIPNSTYFDSTGILPRHPTLLSFFGPGDEATFPITIENVKSFWPTFIFFTNKVSMGESQMLNILNQRYIEIKEDVWILKGLEKKIRLESQREVISLDHLFIYDRRPYIRSF